MSTKPKSASSKPAGPKPAATPAGALVAKAKPTAKGAASSSKGKGGGVPKQETADYKLLTELASTDEAGGLAKERSVLLLWFLRNVIGLDDLDAYEYVCDGDNDAGIDALYLESGTGDDPTETLVIYQSKYTKSPKNIGEGEFNKLISAAAHFKSADNLAALLAGKLEPKLSALIERYKLLAKLKDGAYDDGRLRIRLVGLATGVLTPEAKALIEATNKVEGAGYLQIYDLSRLGPRAREVAAPTAQTTPVKANVLAKELVVVGGSPNRVAVAALRATDIVGWPGLDSRALFALNVRRELARNRVRDQLDGALRRQDEHKDFLAFHNGLTVVCESFTHKNGKLTIQKPSIVNGAQSAIAFAGAADDGELTDDLRVFVKIVETKGRTQLAKEVSWRSNTQTAVNARNLMALGGPQERIRKEIESEHSDFIYEIVPDASFKPPKGKTVIPNDEAAQLLCAVYNAMPWLAVKRLVLFESENHAQIFNEAITGSNIVLAQTIREAVDAAKKLFPAEYRKSWKLTRLVGVYLTAQCMLADDDLAALLKEPKGALADRKVLLAKLELPVKIAATTLSQRFDARQRDSLPDEFNVDFKNRDVLQKLRDEARKNYIFFKTMGKTMGDGQNTPAAK